MRHGSPLVLSILWAYHLEWYQLGCDINDIFSCHGPHEHRCVIHPCRHRCCFNIGLQNQCWTNVEAMSWAYRDATTHIQFTRCSHLTCTSHLCLPPLSGAWQAEVSYTGSSPVSLNCASASGNVCLTKLITKTSVKRCVVWSVKCFISVKAWYHWAGQVLLWTWPGLV